MRPIREIAKEIAAPTIGKVAPAVYREIVADIEQALRNRDERAAEIVGRFTNWARWGDGDISPAPSLERIVAAIRKDD